MPDADVEDARADDADDESRRRPRASLEARARAVLARFDWARDPALFLALTLAAVFSVALVVAAVTSGGARGGASGGRAHVLGRHGRVSRRVREKTRGMAPTSRRDVDGAPAGRGRDVEMGGAGRAERVFGERIHAHGGDSGIGAARVGRRDGVLSE